MPLTCNVAVYTIPAVLGEDIASWLFLPTPNTKAWSDPYIPSLFLPKQPRGLSSHAQVESFGALVVGAVRHGWCDSHFDYTDEVPDVERRDKLLES